MEFSYKLYIELDFVIKSLVWALRVLPLCRKGVLNQKCLFVQACLHFTVGK